MTTHYFPDADELELRPFTRAFVRLMFAHAAFERRISDLLTVITGVPGFGERSGNRWPSNQRVKRMKKLIKEHHPAGLAHTTELLAFLDSSVRLSHDRNLLAHGTWWELDADVGTIAVRAGTDWPQEDQHRTFTIADIDATAISLDNLEVELWKIQRAIANSLGR
ncbi:hypothetical protein [Bradyrhizobium sp. STM 3562]|uniref:hypothetical protein n=1 Tax=Bradyrhizobium sp. STM 3562 TaxID=578924 RepID=UPI00388D2FE2